MMCDGRRRGMCCVVLIVLYCVLCTCTVYVYCVRVQCTSTVYVYCVRVLCTSTVRGGLDGGVVDRSNGWSVHKYVLISG